MERFVREFSSHVMKVLEQALGDDLIALALFGSGARGALRKGSDLDYLIVMKDPLPTYGKRVRRIAPLMSALRSNKTYEDLESLEMDLEPSFVILSEKEITRHPPILLDMVEYSRILHDKDGVLRREIDRVAQRLRELGSQKKRLPDGSWYWVLKPGSRPGEVIEI